MLSKSPMRCSWRDSYQMKLVNGWPAIGKSTVSTFISKRLMRRLVLTRFWEHLYPELEDGDAGLRAAPLEWVGRYLQPTIRSVPLNKSRHDFFKYRESRTVGYEADAKGDKKKLAARQALIDEGKLAPEEFDKAFEATPKAWYKQLIAELDGCVQAMRALDAAPEPDRGRLPVIVEGSDRAGGRNR